MNRKRSIFIIIALSFAGIVTAIIVGLTVWTIFSGMIHAIRSTNSDAAHITNSDTAHVTNSADPTSPSEDVSTNPETNYPEDYNKTLVHYAYYIAPTPREVSSVVFNCDGGIFCLNLTRERLTEIQAEFAADPSLQEVLLSIGDNPQDGPGKYLHFVLYRGDFTFLFDYFQENSSPDSSFTLISEIPNDAIADQAKIPSNVYRVMAFFDQTMTDELLAGMRDADPHPTADTYCLLKQRLSLEGEPYGYYQVFYDELLAIQQTLSEKGVSHVLYTVDILPYSNLSLEPPSI